MLVEKIVEQNLYAELKKEKRKRNERWPGVSRFRREENARRRRRPLLLLRQYSSCLPPLPSRPALAAPAAAAAPWKPASALSLVWGERSGRKMQRERKVKGKMNPGTHHVGMESWGDGAWTRG